MRKFEEIKSEILELAKKTGACSEGILDCQNTTNEIELIDVIVKYISWLIRNKTISAEWIESNFDKALFWERGVYTSGKHYLENPKAQVITLGSSSATVKTRDSSSATVETWGSSSATVETWGSSSATVKTWGSSSKLNYSLGEGSLNMIKDLGLRKLFVNKSQFEIIEI